MVVAARQRKPASTAPTSIEWEHDYRLGSGCKVKHGFAFKGEFLTTEDNPKLPIVVNIVNFQYTGGFRFETTKIQRYTGKFPEEFILKPGDVLLVMTCQTPKGEILGIPGRIPNSGRVYLHNQRMGLVQVTETRSLDLKFLYYVFLSPTFNQHLFATASGAKILHTAPTRIESYIFNRPPLHTQREIASILSAYDDLIENNTRRITILEEMARALYREWFVNLSYPGHQKHNLVNSPIGKIPEGWEPKRLVDLAGDRRDGVNPDNVSPETPYIGLEHLPRRSIAIFEWSKASEVQSTKLIFKKGDILFGKIRPYFHKVGVAPVDGVCSSDAIVIKAKDPRHFPLVLTCVSSDEFVQHAVQTSNGTKMPRANWEVLLKYPIPVPPDEILDKFDIIVSSAVEEIRNLSWRNRNLRATRDLLLPKLVSGEVDVSALDIEVSEGAA